MISFHDQVANWVAESVLAEKDTGKRAVVIEHFIKVADVSSSVTNFMCMLNNNDTNTT